ncbi:hypothetical protein D3C87_596670 [compost metagenome]|uniref:DUF2282 domain-containing protein n=1 Tax=Chryseobacterium viscerum TaxID=1037377 RepID=A0A316W9U5_9FLAO|nr:MULTISPECIES: DUF6520 family protein [Chryseobacterium]PWN58115.1 hypothetical protein C1634_024385 [Chryseobacterium viscerum]
MKKFFIPVALIIMGTGAALASSNSAKTVVNGFRIGNAGEAPCVETPKDCETINTGAVCTYVEGSASYNLKQLNGSMCVADLYEIQP